ncbi:MAG: hypothetical protein EOP06_21620, partial [Proteobacteria bacterium]
MKYMSLLLMHGLILFCFATANADEAASAAGPATPTRLTNAARAIHESALAIENQLIALKASTKVTDKA